MRIGIFNFEDSFPQAISFPLYRDIKGREVCRDLYMKALNLEDYLCDNVQNLLKYKKLIKWFGETYKIIDEYLRQNADSISKASLNDKFQVAITLNKFNLIGTLNSELTGLLINEDSKKNKILASLNEKKITLNVVQELGEEMIKMFLEYQQNEILINNEKNKSKEVLEELKKVLKTDLSLELGKIRNSISCHNYFF